MRPLPARIIRCYRSMYLFTPAMGETEKRLKALHGEWEHIFCNHYEQRDWVSEHAPEWLELYNFYPVDRQREHVFRWLTLWKLGGFWLHTQLRPLASLEPLRERPLVLTEKRRMSPQEFETLHRMPWDAAMPRESLLRRSRKGDTSSPAPSRLVTLRIRRAVQLEFRRPSGDSRDGSAAGWWVHR